MTEFDPAPIDKYDTFVAALRDELKLDVLTFDPIDDDAREPMPHEDTR
jgi:hypothetical protein